MSLEEKFQSFLKSFKDEQGQYKYRDKLAQLSRTNARSIVVDFRDLFTFDREWAEELLESPDDYLDHAEGAAIKQLKMENPAYAEKIGELRVRFQNLPIKTPLRSVGAEHMSKLIMVEGIIVKSTPVKPLLMTAVFKCQACGKWQEVPQTGFFIKIPTRCDDPSCRRVGALMLDMEKSTFINSQQITIQERPEDLPAGQLPIRIDVKLMEDLVDVATPGDRVSIIGIVRPLQELGVVIPRRPRPRSFDLFIEGNYVDTAEKEVEVTISPEEEEEIHSFAKDVMVHHKIMRSIAPSIYGYDEIKESIMYMLFGGVPKTFSDGTRVRGDIHILLIGDPGTAKSQLLQYVAQSAPRGLYTSGKGTTAAGITAAVVREKTGLVLEAGALVLAAGGICCIDEIDKMSPSDRDRIHEAMEQQTVSIAKGGIVATLNARAGILAAGNPAYGRYIPEKTVADNIALPVTVLERFDLIFIMRDVPDSRIDREMADHLLHLHKTQMPPTAPPVSQSFLRKYITYARRINPKVTDEAMERLKEFYLSMRAKSEELKEAAISISPRQLQSLIRLAEARARIALREEVMAEDAEAAINIMKKSFDQVLGEEWDIDRIRGVPKSLREKMSQAMTVIAELESESEDKMASIVDVVEKLSKDYGVSSSEGRFLVSRLIKEGLIHMPKDGYVRRI